MKPFIPNVPLLGQQQVTDEQMVLAAYHSLYFQLVPVVTARLLDASLTADPMLAEPVDVPEQIAVLSRQIAIAAMKQLGVVIG